MDCTMPPIALPPDIALLFDAYVNGLIPGIPPPRDESEMIQGWFYVVQRFQEAREFIRSWQLPRPSPSTTQPIQSREARRVIEEIQQDDLDASWLVGTNVHVTQRAEQQNATSANGPEEVASQRKKKRKRSRSRSQRRASATALSTTGQDIDIDGQDDFLADDAKQTNDAKTKGTAKGKKKQNRSRSKSSSRQSAGTMSIAGSDFNTRRKVDKPENDVKTTTKETADVAKTHSKKQVAEPKQSLNDKTVKGTEQNTKASVKETKQNKQKPNQTKSEEERPQNKKSEKSGQTTNVSTASSSKLVSHQATTKSKQAKPTPKVAKLETKVGNSKDAVTKLKSRERQISTGSTSSVESVRSGRFSVLARDHLDDSDSDSENIPESLEIHPQHPIPMSPEDWSASPWQQVAEAKSTAYGGARPKQRPQVSQPEKQKKSKETVKNTTENPKNHKIQPSILNKQAKAQKNATTMNKTVISSKSYQKMKAEDFPLKNTHDFHLCCTECLLTKEMGRYELKSDDHPCPQDILAVKPINKTEDNWIKIRERKVLRFSKYILCNYFNKGRCNKGESCGFAHSIEELEIWNREGQHVFSLHDFMNNLRNKDKFKNLTVNHILAKHPGKFVYICKRCFIDQSKIVESGDNRKCDSNIHLWDANKVLSHMTLASQPHVSIIAAQPSIPLYYLCHDMEFCDRRWYTNAPCQNAHNLVERDVWMWERDTRKHQSQLVTEDPKKSSIKKTTNNTATVRRSNHSGESKLDAKTLKKPQIVEICRLCWTKGIQSGRHRTLDRCSNPRHNHIWSKDKVFLSQTSKKEIKQFPLHHPKAKFSMCNHILARGKCHWNIYGKGNEPCKFAHSEEELDVWNWMQANQVHSLEELVQKDVVSQKAIAPTASAKSPSPESPWNVPKDDTQEASFAPTIEDGTAQHSQFEARCISSMPQFSLSANMFYCRYCSVSCNDEKQFEIHRASPKHNCNVNSDSEHTWNFRQPPWNIRHGNYHLCIKHAEGGTCPDSNVPDEYNYCQSAHSRDELDEWNDRWNWRQMKLSNSKKDQMLSYMDEIMSEYNSAVSKVEVLHEAVEGIQITCSDELTKNFEDKSTEHTWCFEIQTSQKLEKVALLKNEGRLHFIMSSSSEFNQPQQMIFHEDLRQEKSDDGLRVYVKFSSQMFGSYSQLVAFDFGSRPIVVRKLCVEVGRKDDLQIVNMTREQLSFDRWSSANKTIISYHNVHTTPGVEAEFEKELLCTYKAPDRVEDVVNQQSIQGEINKTNYIKKMHKLIELEEFESAKIIQGCAQVAEVSIHQFIQEDKGAMIFAQPGQLFGEITLTEKLSKDTARGRLILRSVQYILLRRTGSDDKVYEATVVNRDNFGFEGRTQDKLYISFSSRCVTDYELQRGVTIEMEMQMQLDRLPFCKQHHALDSIQDTELIFPDIRRERPAWQSIDNVDIKSEDLNQCQKKVIKQILEPHSLTSLPIIIYGPFGTGKTETLGQATKLLTKDKPRKAKILLCTHSNSAADLYVTRFLDKCAQENGVKVLRVYHSGRQFHTVSSDVQKYCLMSDDQTKFVMPSANEILEHDVVVTTLTTAVYLTNHKELVGAFTHIMVDEAAQVLECEALIPLGLAGKNTTVVFAGDHIQIKPEIFSVIAQKQNYNRSILERLFTTYNKTTRELRMKTSRFSHLLSINYRTKKDILEFLANAFYGGPDNLKSGISVPDVPWLASVSFYATEGQEIQDTETTGFYNLAEIYEVTARVKMICENWPVEWGEYKPESIAVVAAYDQQISRIRFTLRKAGLPEINVGPMHSLQGKEFRAVFISTVRSRQTSIADDGEAMDFGFLTDRHLMNTALTRARSFIGVVGDPIALCSVGQCSGIWKAYIKHCSKVEQSGVQAIFPYGMTYESIMNAILARANEIQVLSEEKDDYDYITDESCDADTEEDQEAMSNVREGIFDWDDDIKIQPDEIIKQLAIEAQKISDVKVMDHAKANEPLNVDIIKIENHPSEAALSYQPRPVWAGQWNKRNLLGADDWDKEFDSENEENDESITAKRNSTYTDDELMGLLNNKPDVYKRCVLNIKTTNKIYGKVRNPTGNDQSLINISSRKRCGRGFNHDEVVVEIIEQVEDEKHLLPENEQNMPQGRVIGVLKRALDPQYKRFVCTVDESGNIMVPLNKDFPIMICLSPERRGIKGKSIAVCTLTKDESVKLHHYEKLHPSDSKKKLFIVRFLKWEPQFFCPLCIVIGTLPMGTSLGKGLAILNLEYFIPQSFPMRANEESLQIAHTFQPQSDQHRKNMTKILAFTIDPEGSQDLDDALSIEATENGFVIAVHIADVSHFLQKDGALDTEAKSRKTTYYTSGTEPCPMLPTCLSEKICSLQPDNDRLTMSLVVTVDRDYTIRRVDVIPAVIHSSYKLTYENAEKIINNEIEQERFEILKWPLDVFHDISQTWRRQRLGNESLFHGLDAESAKSPKAHLLVQEMMIMANREVTSKLMERFPKCTPLHIQMPPDEELLEGWREKHAEAAKNTAVLRKPFLPSGSLCTCSGSCSCIAVGQQFNDQVVQLRKDKFEDIKQNMNNVEMLRTSIADWHHSPAAEIAFAELYKMSEQAEYMCSGDLPPDQHMHSSLNMQHYTHFTSPIRRYIDVAVHRLLTALIYDQPSPYSQEEMSLLCMECTQASRRANQYEQATQRLHLATLLYQNPAPLYPAIEAIDDNSIQLRSDVKCLQGKQRTVKMSNLQPSKHPHIIENTNTVVLNWQQRIYVHNLENIPRDSPDGHQLSTDRFTVQMPVRHWQSILDALRMDNSEDLLARCREALSIQLPCDDSFDMLHSEVTSIAHSNQLCRYEMALHPTDVVKIQMTADIIKGILSPIIQLVELTPKLHICVEHRANAVECFADCDPGYASKQKYKNLEEYKKLWRDLVEIESAQSSIVDGDAILIQNVSIKWHRGSHGIYGTFVLGNDFCESRNLKFSSIDDEGDDNNSDESMEDLEVDQLLDYFCVRYENMPCTNHALKEYSTKFNIDFEQPTVWVGHGLSTDVLTLKKAEATRITIKLLHSKAMLPDELLDSSNERRATLEFIPKSLPKRREEEALYTLSERNQLATAIALGTQPPPLDPAYARDAIKFARTPISSLKAPNQVQQEAVTKAMSGTFLLIQGPPGTGKTVTGVRLANLFALFNREQLSNGKTRPQVMYCGPSNKSVDVVAKYITKQGPSAPKIVRVYSSVIEKDDFPLPLDHFTTSGKKKSTYERKPILEPVSLHHMVRDPTQSEAAEKIRRFDAKIKECIREKTDLSQDDKAEYRTLILDAKKEIIRKSEVILCTCHTSSGFLLKKETNVKQVIIDESGMCTEPESMIPIVACKPDQVVLIGDHKQLRPVIIDNRTRRLGLEISLFERYAKKAHMLDVQYRMHVAIADFPSKAFYENRLKHGSLTQEEYSALQRVWPNGRNKPIAFVHIKGREETLQVATDEGSERSKSNDEEVKKVVNMIFQLVHNHCVLSSQILVLSQYRAQCARIKQELRDRNIRKWEECTVSTVVSAQGSENDYVILSTVRSLPTAQIERKPTASWKRKHLGFIADINQINVALTRAKKGLIIVGNKELLQCHPEWQKLIQFYRESKKLVRAENFLTY